MVISFLRTSDYDLAGKRKPQKRQRKNKVLSVKRGNRRIGNRQRVDNLCAGIDKKPEFSGKK